LSVGFSRCSIVVWLKPGIERPHEWGWRIGFLCASVARLERRT
jgi:hypothetical protein